VQTRSIGARAWVGLACAALLACGCSGATKGAAIGGVAGAATGAVAGGGKGAVIGAAVGATAGAIIGDYMAKQKKDLEKVPGAEVRQEGEELVVTFENPILFDLDSAVLKTQARAILDDVGTVLSKYPDTDLIVMGHTDNSGSEQYNQQLSERRAQTVSNYLVTRGVDSKRLKHMGFGESMPVGTNDTSAGRAENRRVEVKIAANEELREQAEKQADEQSAR
jgi:outer membrane protein OmpA-like peptidoglycan-associated protein